MPLRHFPRTFFDRLLAPILQAARAYAKGLGEWSIFPGWPLLAAIYLQKRVGMPNFPSRRLVSANDPFQPVAFICLEQVRLDLDFDGERLLLIDRQTCQQVLEDTGLLAGRD